VGDLIKQAAEHVIS